MQITCGVVAIAVQGNKAGIEKGIGIGRRCSEAVLARKCFCRQKNIQQMQRKQLLSGQLSVICSRLRKTGNIGIHAERILRKEAGPLG